MIKSILYIVAAFLISMTSIANVNDDYPHKKFIKHLEREDIVSQKDKEDSKTQNDVLPPPQDSIR